MAKAIYICGRRGLPAQIDAHLSTICNALSADNVASQPPRIHRDRQTAFAVSNPNTLVRQRENSLLLGAVFGDFDRWHRPKSALPDGTYALFREDEEYLEIVSDPSGSRTIWYYQDDEQFVASTSQLAIIHYLGSFQFNPAVIPWMLSTTGLGPDQSWDRRIQNVRVDSSVVLHKKSWSTQKRSIPVNFAPVEQSDEAHEEALIDALYSAFESMDIELSDWVVSLSGGYDSRSILAILDSLGRKLDDLGAVTWGTRAALDQRDSDAVIARQIAEHYGIDHRYFVLDESPKRADELIDRFLRCGEGRVDHLAGYLDGFELWRQLYEQDIRGVIRGDEGFGLKVTAVSSPLAVRRSVRFALCTDFSILKNYEQYGLPRQEIPDYLRQRPGESLSTWRDRLFHVYKLPIIVAALSDLKSPYLDQISPLLSRTILDAMRQLPDRLRDEKILFRRIVDQLGPPIPIAARAASIRTRQAIRRNDLLRLIEEELRSDHARSVLPTDFVERILRQFVAVRDFADQKSPLGAIFNLKRQLYWLGSKLTPRPVKNALAATSITHHMDAAVVAWRLFVISRMTARLQSAARQGKRQRTSSSIPPQLAAPASPLEG